MTLISLFVFLIVIGLIFWVVRALSSAFGHLVDKPHVELGH